MQAQSLNIDALTKGPCLCSFSFAVSCTIWAIENQEYRNTCSQPCRVSPLRQPPVTQGAEVPLPKAYVTILSFQQSSDFIILSSRFQVRSSSVFIVPSQHPSQLSKEISKLNVRFRIFVRSIFFKLNLLKYVEIEFIY